MYPDLRSRSLEGLLEIGFDGYAIGGLSVGEPKDEMFSTLRHIAPVSRSKHNKRLPLRSGKGY